ncbi:MAG: TetR/AcrR family transcriptional regulator [Halobacteriaceae archaeon]
MDTEASDEILGATYRALCKHGHADLTMQRIADESSLSTAAFHYHFDTKADLLDAFLEHLIDQFEDDLACESSDPGVRLRAFLDAVFDPAASAADRDSDFPVALYEIKARSPYQQTYRARLVEMDRRMHEVLASAVRDGVEAGRFDEADPDEVARFVVTLINGAHSRQVALGEDPETTRALVEDYLERRLGWSPEVVA